VESVLPTYELAWNTWPPDDAMQEMQRGIEFADIVYVYMSPYSMLPSWTNIAVKKYIHQAKLYADLISK
jgi:hypothetical protein